MHFRCEIDDNLCSTARIGVIFDMVGPYKPPGNYWYGDGHSKRKQRHIKKKLGHGRFVLWSDVRRKNLKMMITLLLQAQLPRFLAW